MLTAEQKAAWLSERCGRLTASRMTEAMSFRKDGKPSAERTKLMYDLLAERVTGFNARNVVTPAMQEGLDYEDEMFDYFVERTGKTLRPSRFYPHRTIDGFGATPDREPAWDNTGLIEGKVPQPATFIRWTLSGTVPEEHWPQMTAQLLCTDREWVGFIAYCPHIKDEGKRLYMRKFTPDADYRARVFAAAVGFLAELDDMWERFVTTPESVREPAAA